MFGTKKFKTAKTKKFESSKERKQFFAVQAYYKNKPKKGAYSAQNKFSKD